MKKIFIAIIIAIILGSVLLPIIPVFAADACTEVTPKNKAEKENKSLEGNQCWTGERGNDELCCPKGGLVICGSDCCRCTFCDFFRLIEKIIEFAVLKIAPIAAVLLIIIGGVMFLISSGDPSKVTRAKGIIFSVILGLVIIYGSYMAVGLILKSIGLAGWVYGDENGIFNSFINDGAFDINCGGNTTSGSGTSGDTSGSGSDDTFSGLQNPFCVGLDKSGGCKVYQDRGRLDLCSSDPCEVSSKGCRAYSSQLSYGSAPKLDTCASK